MRPVHREEVDEGYGHGELEEQVSEGWMDLVRVSGIVEDRDEGQ